MSDYQPNKVIPGTVYKVVQLLGQGGMGTVYEVEDTTVGKHYVLKTLHSELRDRKELAARINKEARVLARLSHPNIVEVVTAGMTADKLRLPYFVMQRLNGHTLRSVLLAKGRLVAVTALSIAIDLLDALDHAHGMGVIHRDVKPENIFLHRSPNDAHQTKLLDFGVMRLLSGEQPQTGARFVGTLRYAPPEQLLGEAITPQTDLYATGLVLYEMLSGSGPFDEETNDREIAKAHLERAPPPLSSRVEVSTELEAIVMSALAKDPDRRPRDAFSFAAKLRDLARTETFEATLRTSRPVAVPASTADPGSRVASIGSDPLRNATTTGAISSHASAFPRQRRAALLIVAALAVAIVAGAWIVGARSQKAQATQPVTTTPILVPSPKATPNASATPTPTPNANAIPTPNATPTSTSTSNATPTPNVTPTPNASVPPPHPRPAAHPAEHPSAKPRLPGPGF